MKKLNWLFAFLVTVLPAMLHAQPPTTTVGDDSKPVVKNGTISITSNAKATYYISGIEQDYYLYDGESMDVYRKPGTYKIKVQSYDKYDVYLEKTVTVKSGGYHPVYFDIKAELDKKYCNLNITCNAPCNLYKDGLYAKKLYSGEKYTDLFKRGQTYTFKAVDQSNPSLSISKSYTVGMFTSQYTTVELDLKSVAGVSNSGSNTSAKEGKVLINEDFSSQSTEFSDPINTSDYEIIVNSNGWYDYHNKSATMRITSTTVDEFDQSRDFSISCDIFIVDAGDEGAGIGWGNNSGGSTNNNFRILIAKNNSGDLQYYCDHSVGGTNTVIKPWTETSAVKDKSWNTLTVKKIGSTYTYYINGNYMLSTPYEYLKGKQFGLLVSGRYYGHFDNFKLTYLDGDSKPVVSSTQEVLLYEDFSSQTTGFSSPTDLDDYSIKIENGWYAFQSKIKASGESSSHSTTQRLDNFKEYKDFTISTEIFVRDASDFGSGIKWGDVGNNKEYYFLIAKNTSGEHHYCFYQATGSGANMLKDWTDLPAVKDGAWNTIAVKKIGSNYIFYINDTELFRYAYTTLTGKNFGMYVSKAYIGYFSSFKVTN